MEAILGIEEVATYLNKLSAAVSKVKPEVTRDRSRSTLDYTTKLANVKIKFSESGNGGSISMWVHLHDTGNIYLNYIVSSNETDVVLRVEESNSRILDVNGNFSALAANAAGLLGMLQERVQDISTSKVLTEMAVIDELLENV